MLAGSIVVVCFLLRLLPHPPNFAPLGASAVFAGRTLPLRWAVAATLGAHLLSSIVLGAVQGFSPLSLQTGFVWLGLAAQCGLGRGLRSRRGGALLAAASGSLAFFVISNLGVYASGYYGSGPAALLACYVAAIPFYPATLASDLLYTAALCLGYRPLARRLARYEHAVLVPVSEMAVL